MANKKSRELIVRNQIARVPKSRADALAVLVARHGLEYALTRNSLIVIGTEARDCLRDFATYVGSDGKRSRSAYDKDGNLIPGGGRVHVAVTTRINQLLELRSVKDLDAIGDAHTIAKLIHCWSVVKPVLEACKTHNLPREKCFAQLWKKLKQIADFSAGIDVEAA